MTCVTVDAPSSVWRVGRGPNPLKITIPLELEELNRPNAGSRFDSPLSNFGVLYFGTSREACYVETLARFRPDPKVVAFIRDEWEKREFPYLGGIPAEWRLNRLAVRVSLADGLPFLDLTAPETQQHLRTEMADYLVYLGYKDLDASAVMGPDRRLTRWISHWAFNSVDPHGVPLYGGIRYGSRLGAKYECWAAFHDIPYEPLETKPILLEDEELRRVAAMYNLIIF